MYMRNEGRPKQVQDALWHADQNALSAMGRKGGRQAAENRALREAERNERVQEIILEKARTETITNDGDVLPPDPNIIADLENN